MPLSPFKVRVPPLRVELPIRLRFGGSDFRLVIEARLFSPQFWSILLGNRYREAQNSYVNYNRHSCFRPNENGHQMTIPPWS